MNASGMKRVPRDPSPGRAGKASLSLLLYSDNSDTREEVVLAVGRRPAADVSAVEWTECGTATAVIDALRQGGVDLVILDGEARPMGGMGLCKQLKDEIRECPPVLLLTGRPDDAWLATWSRADHVVPRPLDPIVLANAVADLARELASGRDEVAS